jgi:hypothetical protein
MTKKEAAKRKADWSKALAEGRVVRYNNGMQLRSFASIVEAEDFLKIVREMDKNAIRVQV